MESGSLQQVSVARWGFIRREARVVRRVVIQLPQPIKAKDVPLKPEDAKLGKD
jgi:hypothetical protein